MQTITSERNPAMDAIYWEPTPENQLREARKLDNPELARHASVCSRNRCPCTTGAGIISFCCACLAVKREREAEHGGFLTVAGAWYGEHL